MNAIIGAEQASLPHYKQLLSKSVEQRSDFQSHRFEFDLCFFSTSNQPEEGKVGRVLPSAALMDGQRGSSPVEYFVRRKVLDEARLDDVGQKQKWCTKPSLGERATESLR